MVDSTPRPSDLRLAEAIAYVYGVAPRDEQPRPSHIRMARAIAQALLEAGIGAGGEGGSPIPSTDALPEGINNLYFTSTRARDALFTTLQGYAPTSHMQPISSVTGLQAALDAKTPYGHAHDIASVTGLQTALDGKAPTVHNHEISNVNGLQAALDNLESSDIDDTDELPEGTTNLYYTNARADTRADGRIEAQKGQANGLVPLKSDRTISNEYITLVLENIAALQVIPKPANNSKVAYVVKGYYTAGDDGGGIFYWDESDTTTAVDGGLFFLVNGVSANGRWKRLIEGDFVSAAWFGLRSGIGTTHATANANAIQTAINSNYNVFIPAGNYTINRGIRISAGYFNSIGKSAFHGWGKTLRGTGRNRCRLYCWTGNVPIIDLSGTTNFSLEDIEFVNANTVGQGATEGGANASALGITMCRDVLTTFNHYNSIKRVIVALNYQNNSTQLDGIGTIGFFGLGCEHIYLENCTFAGNIAAVFTRVYGPSYITANAATGGLNLSTWNIRNYLPNHSGEVASSCLIGRVDDCVFINNDFRHPVLVLDRIGSWTFTNAYMSNREGGTNGTYQYLIYNANANNIIFQGMAEPAGLDGATARRRVGFMISPFFFSGWRVDYFMAYGIPMPSTFTSNVGMIHTLYNGVNTSGYTNCEFNISSSATDNTGFPVTSNTTLAQAFLASIQNCVFHMDTSGGNADIIADNQRIRNVRCYDNTNAVQFFTSRSWEDYGVWAYGRVSNTGVRDANATSPRCPSSSLTTTTYRVNYSQALTFAYLAINLTIEGATANLCPVITNRQPTYFEYQVFNTSNTAVTAGFTQVNFMITQVSADNSFS